MKKKILTLLALLAVATTGAWAQGSDPDPIELTSTDGETWTLASMPDYEVELEVEYYDEVTLTAKADPAGTGYYYTTFYDGTYKYSLPTGVEAYVGTKNGNYLTLTKIADAGQIIPAATAVILKASSSSYTLIVSDGTAVTFDVTNDLTGVDVATTISGSSYEDKTIYTLAAEDTDDDDVKELGFYKYTGTTLGANKAFLPLAAAASVKGFAFSFEGEETGVQGVSSATRNDVIYDLSGRRVSKPTKGLYIVNGKKIVVP